MICKPFGPELIVWSPAKVNLFLEILGKRADGYHEIQTLMTPVSLFDTIRFKEEPSGTVRLHCSDNSLSTDEDNLILQAVRLLQTERSCNLGVSIQLTKRIPMAAGLAGGSSNAAATLFALNQLWQLQLSQETLAEYCSRLGSDIPFFLFPGSAWCTGRGERIEPTTWDQRLWLVLVCPPFGLSTAEVYRTLKLPKHPEPDTAFRKALATNDINTIGRALRNRLQEPAELLQPQLRHILTVLEQHHPAGQLMSGSGSTVFALCRDCQQGRKLVHTLRNTDDLPAGTKTYLVHSLA